MLADEGHQHTTHADSKEFVYFRELAKELGTTVEVLSFHVVPMSGAAAGSPRAGAVAAAGPPHF